MSISWILASLKEPREYLAAIRRVTQRTGYFWYSLSDCAQSYCDAHARDCQNFKNVKEEFLHAHLNKPYMKIVDRVFLSLLNIGGDVEKLEAGTMSEVVRPRGRSHILLFSAVGCAIALFLLIVVVAFLVCRVRVLKKKKEIKEPHPTHP